MRKILILSFVILTGMSSSTFAQRFQEKTKMDGVSVYFKWSHQNPIDKNSPLQLVIKMVNENDKAVNVSCDIQFIMDGKLKETAGVDGFCIKAGKSANGRFNGLVFSTRDISNAQIESDAFAWDLVSFTVEELDACPE